MESDVPLRVLVTQMIRKILGIRGESSSPLMKILHKLTHVPLGPHKQKKMMIEDLALVQTSGYFDSEWYLKKYPINLGTGTNPAEHFLNIGGFEGRDPGPFFSSSTYIAENPDVMTAKLNPLVHYLRFGKREGRRIKPSFLR